MPHDKNGARLSVGDLVMVPCRVTAIHDTETYCNLDLETIHRMPPRGKPTALTLNAKQTEKPTDD